MLRNDYFSRLTEKVTGIDEEISKLRREGKTEKGRAVLKEGYKALGIGRDMTLLMPVADMLRFSGRAGISSDKNGYLLSKLIEIDGDLSGDEGKTEAAAGRYKTALEVISQLDDKDESEIKADIAAEVKKLNEKLSSIN